MIKKLVLVIWFLGALYLALPTPVINPYIQGLKSTEEGDTGQIKNIIAAYYTNQDRQEIIDQVRSQFNHIRLFDKITIPLPAYTLEHPPEYAKQVIIETHDSWHFKELVHWQRESLFISFWEPAKRNQSLNLKNPNYLLKGGQKWQSKVTFYYIKTSLWARQLVWLLEVLLFYTLIKVLSTTPNLVKQLISNLRK